MELSLFTRLALISIAVLAALMLAVLFEPGLRYQIISEIPPSETYEFRSLVGALVDEPLMDGAEVVILTNGKNFYHSTPRTMQEAHESLRLRDDADHFWRTQIDVVEPRRHLCKGFQKANLSAPRGS